ncbi:cytochrome c oxidase assembly protein COX16 homolog, mitochondrial [Ischnura elegans]|uniref:cytochrome c oxidase assembly protein COX16 homolog, mitochondrial n=1 Tax=Ischnura elegans TaxID=197161 RepID=UPI001ED8B12B|nr:cytochrome c oxidase assembly protein COX16 homolog, mitochondrial [Ischnura elegans]XP_046400701.1 cytochrome c oxidase assembly protein COX16 homolog, mitochondrial [Ischnura elegans]XP_046400702.1 cytochrome c oxidase assembly protein COX16 homolog, mitochondrial [Ischnura elegans]XP_046400703.1 cytochrome c oxidase assembly protein COX16 homolog, mitochondrial [Ischnura elegans]
MNDWRQKINVVTKRKSFRYGLPFIILMIGSSFALEQFSQIRYRFSKKAPVNPELMEKFGVNMKKPGEVTLETEYEKIKNLDIDNWTNVRGPRPWEK